MLIVSTLNLLANTERFAKIKLLYPGFEKHTNFKYMQPFSAFTNPDSLGSFMK
jgi:hypothetical protein